MIKTFICGKQYNSFVCAQSGVSVCDPMECSPPGSSVHGISQARVLEWLAISFSRGSSPPRDGTHVACIAGGFFTIWATWPAHSWWQCLLSDDEKKEERYWNRLFSWAEFLPLGHQGPVSWKTFFFTGRGGWDHFRMIQERSTNCTLYFFYYPISFTSDHQALDPRVWGPLPKRKHLM